MLFQHVTVKNWLYLFGNRCGSLHRILIARSSIGLQFTQSLISLANFQIYTFYWLELVFKCNRCRSRMAVPRQRCNIPATPWACNMTSVVGARCAISLRQKQLLAREAHRFCPLSFSLSFTASKLYNGKSLCFPKKKTVLLQCTVHFFCTTISTEVEGYIQYYIRPIFTYICIYEYMYWY